ALFLLYSKSVQTFDHMPEHLLHIVLHNPEIPPNTGNIIRLCANTGCQLHLIEPMGFALEDKKLRRAGLDYHEFASVRIWPDIATCMQSFDHGTVYACSTKGKHTHSEASFRAGDVLIFGAESCGLPGEYLASLPPQNIVRIPMLAHSRSMNLSNAVSVMVYEAWRQMDFGGALKP
ncbi:MAG: tRNA (cytidine/uridine-2-O-)-methyltransferase, partial [Pseudomonadota bacterium]|nr:tRNA (cytidine/uridine-2-O-)-methyltransferase [Pseudomonadota bacterium]